MSPTGNSFVGSSEICPFRNCEESKLSEISELYLLAVERIMNNDKTAKRNTKINNVIFVTK